MKKFLMTLAIMTLLGSAAMAQDAWKLVESQRFRFIAYRINSSLSQADPRFATLNEAGYGLEVTKKWIQCKLPFVGKVYRSSLNEQHVEIFEGQYTYEYKKVKRRKATDMVVKMSARSSDGSDKFDMTFVIDENGNANLTVRSNYRETVTYYGKILPVGLPEK